MAAVAERQQQPIRSTIPARLDRLRWTPFHTRLVLGLGAAWVLDGLSITIASSVTSKLTQPNTLNLSTAQAASIGTLYLVGEVIGALVFGRMSDTLGRRKLFTWTLAVYLVGTALTALTPKGSGWIVYLYATRIIAGMGIGGEYSAINSAIDEMMPARYRGRTDVWINGTYWLGAIIGTFATFLLLSTLRTSEGWRICFLVGPALAFVIIFIRRNLPESPRWLITHGRVQEAEEAVRRIEEAALRDGQHLDPVPESAAITIVPERRYGYLTLLRVAFRQYPKRAILGATLMITQSFLYNAIFFTYALVLTKFYHVSNNAVPLYGLAFAVGNLAGPLLLGHLFDSVGRKKMISGTYLISGGMLAFSAWLFAAGILSAAGQTFIWIIIFFFASAGASAGYLTVSEIFPIEIRAEALAVFFAMAQIFGAVGPAFYGVLIGNGSNRANLAIGYLVGGGIMIIGGVVEAMFGINAEGKSLEAIAPPLTEVGSGKQGGMNMTVIVGVDSSEASKAALRLAAQEARWRQASLVAVSAYELPLGPVGGFPGAAMHTQGEEQATAEAELRATVDHELGDEAGQAKVRVSAGLAGRVIIEAAREAHAELIVLAAHPGRSVVPGTVSQYVLLKARCPATIVPDESTDEKTSSDS